MSGQGIPFDNQRRNQSQNDSCSIKKSNYLRETKNRPPKRLFLLGAARVQISFLQDYCVLCPNATGSQRRITAGQKNDESRLAFFANSDLL
jgi:hypothetical protein